MDERLPLISSTPQGSTSHLHYSAAEDVAADTDPNIGPGGNFVPVDPMECEITSTNGSEEVTVRSGPIVSCRVCEAEISIEGKAAQHVVRCQQCNEVTPIKAAPPGKKYVRCPCNCLLVCKAASNRIACPRPNCRRVITLVASAPVGTAVRAPAGTCRVQCSYCLEVFMFNALANQVANCPHCKQSSSVGARYARSRSVLYGISFLASFIFLFTMIVGLLKADIGHPFVYLLVVGLFFSTWLFAYKFVYYLRMKISQILGPI